MNNAGVFQATAAVTVAGTQVTDWIEDLDGMIALSILLQFIYGSGGSSCKVYLQQTFDGGVTVEDVACAAFTTSSATKGFNISGLTPKLTPQSFTDGTMTDDTAQDGILGNALRLKVVSTGTYGGSTQVVARLGAK